MQIGFLFPKVYELSRQAFTDVNSFKSYQFSHFWTVFLLCAVVIAAIIIAVIKKKFVEFSENVHVLAVEFAVCIITVALLLCFACATNCATKSINSPESGFEINQTSFYISPTTTKPDVELQDYLTDTSYKIVTTSDYAVCAKISNVDKSITKYLIAESHDGNLAAPSLEAVKNAKGFKVKVATPEMLTALFSYAKYIENHHLEDEFKNDAKLKFTNKYLDAKYNPTLVMQGKNDQILHMKNKANVSDKNVVLDK